MPRLLCITAHPDDEAGNFGGTLARYAAAGVETYVVCLTPGQAARNRGAAKNDAELSAMRREEFQAACKLLRVHHGEVLNFADAALPRVDFYAAVEELVARVRAIRPQVMITMGPEGAITAHPDHSMTSILATMAYHWAGRSDRFVEQLTGGAQPHRTQKLYYGTAEFTIPGRQPVSLPPITARIDVREYLATKIGAFKLHTTQAPLFPIFEGNVAKHGGYELFHLAAAMKAGEAKQETDLFAGIEE